MQGPVVSAVHDDIYDKKHTHRYVRGGVGARCLVQRYCNLETQKQEENGEIENISKEEKKGDRTTEREKREKIDRNVKAK